MTYRVRVLSSYIFDRDAGPFHAMGLQSRWLQGFAGELLRQGLSLKDFALDFVRLPDHPAEVAAAHRDVKEQEVDLVICAGVDAIIRWSRACHDVPTLAYGGFPENNGLEVFSQPNIAGMRLNLPLVWSNETFSLVKALLPGLSAVYVPINFRSESAVPGVAAAFSEFRRRSTEFWIPGTSGYCGFRSFKFLVECSGCEYFEGPYTSVTELLLRGLTTFPAERAAIIGFNDSVLAPYVANTLLRWCREHEAPLVWVNCWPVVKAGGIADFSDDFKEVGTRLATQALRILRDKEPVSEIGFDADLGQRFSLNLRRCAELGLEVEPTVRSRFHVVAE